MASEKHGKRSDSWWTTTAPTTGPTGAATTWVGARVHFTVPGRVCGLRFWDGWSGDDSTILLFMDWLSVRRHLRAVPYRNIGTHSAGWNQAWFHPFFRVTTTDDYAVLCMYRGGGFFRTNAALTSPVTHTGIQFKSGFQSTVLDTTTGGFTENTNANAVDVLFLAD